MFRRLLAVLGVGPDLEIPDREFVIAALKRLGVK